MSREACPAGFPLWIFIWTWPTDVSLCSTKRSIFEWVPQPPLPWTLYPEGRLQRFFPASQGMCAFTVWTSYISEFSPTSFQVYNACVFLCSRSVNHRLTGRCIMKTLKKTWGSSALRAAPGLENAARETCTAASKTFEPHVLTLPQHCTALSLQYAALTHETQQRPEDVCLVGTVIAFQGLVFKYHNDVSLPVWFDRITFKLPLFTILISLEKHTASCHYVLHIRLN